MIKIGICGVHASGKSTKAMEMRDHFADLGKKVIVVNEVARSCPLPLRTVDAQEWIWVEQLRREQHAMAQDVDVIICDRTVMDHLIYYYHIVQDASYLEQVRWCELHRIAIGWMPTYTQVIRLPLNLEWLQADDPLRSKDAEYARQIDELFDRFVQPYVTQDGDISL